MESGRGYLAMLLRLLAVFGSRVDTSTYGRGWTYEGTEEEGIAYVEVS